MNVLFAALIIFVIGYFIIKKYKAQTMLLIGGLTMMVAAYLMGYATEFVPKAKSTGSIFFDMFEYINILLAKDVAGLGLMIMTCTGFAKYMDHIGASSRLVYTAIKPLGKMNAPYLVMSLTFFINMFMSLVIPSASGLAMLMMVTIFPILVRLGVSPYGAAAAVATGHLLDIGPASATSLLVAKTAGIPIHEYFLGYQLKVYVICGVVASIGHYVWQQYLDKKEGHIRLTEEEMQAQLEEKQEKVIPPGPPVYMLLPILPLVFILGFSKYGYPGIKMNVNLAMFSSLFIAMVCEYIRYRDLKKVAASIQSFFKGMGDQFTATVTLIVAGETFAFGLTSLGVVTAFVDAIHSMSLSLGVIFVGISILIVGLSMVMGSGVASMFAFAPLVPEFAAQLGANSVSLLLAMQNAASLGRIVSPISAVMIAVAGIANISSLDLVKRTSVPVILSFIASTIAILVIF